MLNTNTEVTPLLGLVQQKPWLKPGGHTGGWQPACSWTLPLRTIIEACCPLLR